MFSPEAFQSFFLACVPQSGAPIGPVTLLSLKGGLTVDAYDGGIPSLPLCCPSPGTIYNTAYQMPTHKSWSQAGEMTFATEEADWILWNTGEPVKPKIGDRLVSPSWIVGGVVMLAGPTIWKVSDVQILGLGLAFQCKVVKDVA